MEKVTLFFTILAWICIGVVLIRAAATYSWIWTRPKYIRGIYLSSIPRWWYALWLVSAIFLFVRYL